MATESGAPVDRIRSHWWWRPGWSYGRRCHTWRITFAERPEVHRLVSRYQSAMLSLLGFDLAPLESLHLTVQDVGFTDEVGEDEANAVVDLVQRHLAGTRPPEITLRGIVITEETVALPVLPTHALDSLREVVRGAAAEVLGAERVPAPPEGPARLSIAYANSDVNPVFVRALVSDLDLEPVSVPVDSVSSLVLHRDHQMYEWDKLATVRLG
ncbi:2'-5' RNA ligase family protein [Streptoalloteichus hindustanus]|uniref:2'-5' RNA ligase superfamily protein n=1 Tax=Streptoalloteichus hindustanus TaxID=2017 RepID=A0A1M4UP54_STRHI|nr:2'-5' RNA ligase family protein [Streptoalloteichus hindustanus]SHE58370.1 2'-5' RNA ligase superfamily protein [Streptoalloteichus hindustanus]